VLQTVECSPEENLLPCYHAVWETYHCGCNYLNQLYGWVINGTVLWVTCLYVTLWIYLLLLVDITVYISDTVQYSWELWNLATSWIATF